MTEAPNKPEPVMVIANLDPDGGAFAWGWHDKDDFLTAWDEVDAGDGLCDTPREDWYPIVCHWWAIEVADWTGHAETGGSESGFLWGAEPREVSEAYRPVGEWRKATVLNV